MRLSRILRLLCAGTILATAALAALAEPPAEPAKDFSEIIDALTQKYAAQRDALYATYGPFRYNPEMANAYIRADERFAEVIDRMTVYYLADPDKRRQYEDMVARGGFEGSAEEYARFLVVSWLGEPQYGYNAAIYSPNPSNGERIIEAWRVSSTRGSLAKEEPCTNQWTARKPVAALAHDFERAVNGYLQWAYSEDSVMTAFNPDSVNFIDASSEREFLRAAISFWLASSDETLLQAPVCAKTFTNFDSWAAWDAKNVAQAGPFSGGYAPE